MPVHETSAVPALAGRIRQSVGSHNWVVVAPDGGGLERARCFAHHLSCGLAFIDPRSSRERGHSFDVVGDVRGKDAIVFSDVIGSGVPQLRAALALEEQGASRVYAAATHAVFSGSAARYIDESPIAEVYVTDTIVRRPLGDKVVVVGVAEMIAEAIHRVRGDEPEEAT